MVRKEILGSMVIAGACSQPTQAEVASSRPDVGNREGAGARGQSNLREIAGMSGLSVLAGQDKSEARALGTPGQKGDKGRVVRQ